LQLNVIVLLVEILPSSGEERMDTGTSDADTTGNINIKDIRGRHNFAGNISHLKIP
jgi:hypothetical protein